MFTSRFFMIKALTNMHVGSGDRNFSVVDNYVQRDEITQIPIIQASSLKGALREFASVGGNGNKLSPEQINFIFGSDGTSDGTANKNSAGEFRFLQAELLALPVRATHKPFYLAVTKEMIQALVEMAETLGVGLDLSLPGENLESGYAYVSDDQSENAFIEDFPCRTVSGLEKLQAFLGYDHIALFTDETFKSITSVLPVIARNKIGKDGISENLFYEEIVPRQSLFGFFICMPSNELIQEESRESVKQRFDAFIERMTKDPIQIGANASIGYGLTKINEVQG